MTRSDDDDDLWPTRLVVYGDSRTGRVRFDPDPTVALVADVSGLQCAMIDMTAAAGVSWRAFAEGMRRITAASGHASTNFLEMARQLREARFHLAHANYDASDDTWQSDQCAGWLHSSCEASSASYDCTCHGGRRR